MINNVILKNLKAGTLSDDGSGLYVRVLKSGSKQFYCRKFLNGHSYTKALGLYPALSLTAARKMAAEFIASLTPKDGIPALTFNDVYSKWWKVKKTQITNERSIRQHMRTVLREFGKRAFLQVTTLEMSRFFDRFTESGSKRLTMAMRAAIYLKQVETYAVNAGYATSYRFQGINKTIAARRVVHFPSVAPRDLPEILQKIKDESLSTGAMIPLIKMAFYTLLRPGEYCQMKWEWISDDAIVLPPEIMKMKRPHRVPVTKQIKALLDSFTPFRTACPFIFPSPLSPLDAHITDKALQKFFRIHGLAGILVPHGIRSIGRTWLAENGVRPEVAEACLAHVFGNAVIQTYTRTDFFNERRAVMQKWNDFVDSCFSAPRIRGRGKYFVFA